MQPFAFVQVIKYVPDIAVVAVSIAGVGEFDVKPFGPLQTKPVACAQTAAKFKVLPVHTIGSQVAVITGRAFTVIVFDADAVQPVAFVTVT